MSRIDDEIKDAEEKVRKLKAKKEKLETMKVEPRHNVAVQLHSLFCHSEHTESCGWFYEMDNEVDDWSRDTHARYLDKAERFIKLLGAEQAARALAALSKVWA